VSNPAGIGRWLADLHIGIGVGLGSTEQPLVSIVIPAYMAAGRIRATLDSAFAQTYPNIEVVLVNDGSPDTLALEEAIRGYDGRLIYIRQENRGPSGARNTAIRAARGKYIACLDSDDVYLPEHLSRQVEMLERDGLALTYSDSQIFKNGVPVGRAFEHEPQHPPVTFEKLLNEECCVMTSAVVASRQAMMDAGLFDERFRRCEDFDLWLRISFRGGRMDYDRSVGIEHRLLPTGLSSDGYLLKQGRIEIYKKTQETLALSAAQRELIRDLIAMTEGKSQMDMVKRHVREGRYAEAAAAAQRAAVLLQDNKTRWTAWALRTMPWAVGSYLGFRGRIAARKRKRDAGSNGNLKTQDKSVQLQSEGLVGRNQS
jgi:glycosyltransferase involved in cell wall biosynthesis